MEEEEERKKGRGRGERLWVGKRVGGVEGREGKLAGDGMREEEEKGRGREGNGVRDDDSTDTYGESKHTSTAAFTSLRALPALTRLPVGCERKRARVRECVCWRAKGTFRELHL